MNILAGQPANSWAHVLRVTRPALLLAPKNFLGGTRASLDRHGVVGAVAERHSGPIFDWLQTIFPMQGISDRSAAVFANHHGYARWIDIERGISLRPVCPKLKSHWHFSGCGYSKTSGTCSNPKHIARCALPHLPLRKGMLNQAAYGLFMFLRDVCDGDLVSWIDERFDHADEVAGGFGTGAELRDALLEPLANIPGTGKKLWSMALADLLLVGRPADPRWQRAGAAMRAIDSLVHAFLARTGCLARLGAQHPYGPACYGSNGCASVIEGLAGQIDASAFGDDFPSYFPRFVQFALWHFCAADGLAICNGRTVNDRVGCTNRYCPSFGNCDRRRLAADR